MADYELNNAVKFSALKALAQKTKTELTALDTKFSTAFRSLSVSGNTVSFYTNDNATGTAAYSFDFPEELFLDQAGTTLVSNFAFDATTYPGATDPQLDGKTVLVLAVKGDATTPTVKYSFVNLEKLIDTYTAADNSININGYNVNVKISAAENNAITLKNDGLHVDISGKVDKTDFQPVKDKVDDIEEGAQVNIIETVKVDGTALTVTDKAVDITISGKADKVANATAGNLAGLDANGNLTDSGVTFAPDTDVTAMLTEVFGA